MAIEYKWGRKGWLRNALFKLRAKLPASWRISVWRRTSRAIFARRKFEEKVPLFRSVELETRTRCNSTCAFCAASILSDQRPDVYMPEPLYEKILQNLADLNYSGAIKFFVNNEPLLDKRTADFIARAKEIVPEASTEVHTNGLKLTPKTGEPLLKAGLDLLYINNYTTEGKMHRGVEKFLRETAPKFPKTKVVFHLRQLDAQLLNRGGTAPNAVIPTKTFDFPCILPFEELVITASGKVAICCQDHYFEDETGNVNSKRLEEIWYGKRFTEIREALKKGDRTVSKFCEVCDYKGFKDEHQKRGELLKNRMVGDLLSP